MDNQETVTLVKEKMQALGLTQRELAARLEISQGHLCKVLQGKIQRRSRTIRAMEAWLGKPDEATELDANANEQTLLDAAREAASGSDRAMHLMVELMHLVKKLRGP